MSMCSDDLAPGLNGKIQRMCNFIWTTNLKNAVYEIQEIEECKLTYVAVLLSPQPKISTNFIQRYGLEAVMQVLQLAVLEFSYSNHEVVSML